MERRLGGGGGQGIWRGEREDNIINVLVDYKTVNVLHSENQNKHKRRMDATNLVSGHDFVDNTTKPYADM